MDYVIVNDVEKIYGEGETAFRALKEVSLNISKGEFVTVMGESGSGKSTLLSVLGALNGPDKGSVLIDEIDMYTLDSEQRSDFRREFLGFVFQSFYLLPYLTVEENVMLPLVPKGLTGKEKSGLAQKALAKVGLQDKSQRLPGQISGGEAERAAVARAIVNSPAVLLADEPTGNLDSGNSLKMMELFSSLNDEGMTIIMVTHSKTCAEYGKRRIVLCDGIILEDSRAIKIETISG